MSQSRNDYYGYAPPQPGPPVAPHGGYPQPQIPPQIPLQIPMPGYSYNYNAPPPQPHYQQYPPPPQGGYQHQAPIGYAAPPPPPPQSMGYGYPAPAPPQMYQQQHQFSNINVAGDISAIHKACRGFGTDNRALISIIGSRDGPTIDAIRRTYSHGDLIKLLQKETSGHYETALLATAFGPVESHAFFAQIAVKGAGTNETMLTESIMGRSRAELEMMRQAYRSRYGRQLEADVLGDLSFKTKELFHFAISAGCDDEGVFPGSVNPQHMAGVLYQAARGFGTDETTVSKVLTSLNTAQLRAVAHEYKRVYGVDLATMIRKEFSGHMKDVFLFLVDGAMDKPTRDARLLEESMKGFGTKDELLIMRVVRIHWDKEHLRNVKNAYRSQYGRELFDRIRGETSGNYREMLLELIK